MPTWFIVVILGFVEGLTEFIPVSSTGHLLIVEHWLGSRQSDLFNVVIQCGAVVAVLPLFRGRLAMLARWRERASIEFNIKIFVCFFITCVGGLVIDKLGFELPETVQPVAWALIIGGAIFIGAELFLKGRKQTDEVTWLIVAVVAAGQLLAAIFPGASRSGATIILAMLCGMGRSSATEFSFLVGIPTLLAAGGLKIFKELHAGGQEDWGLVLLGTAVSAVVSFLAVKWLLSYVRNHTFVSFGIYRIVLGVALFWIL